MPPRCPSSRRGSSLIWGSAHYPRLSHAPSPRTAVRGLLNLASVLTTSPQLGLTETRDTLSPPSMRGAYRLRRQGKFVAARAVGGRCRPVASRTRRNGGGSREGRLFHTL